MYKVKICGIRLMREIHYLNITLPDYAGFVFAPSKRMVTPGEAAFLIHSLDKAIIPVGVFVNHPIDFVTQAADLCGLKCIQLHGDEDINYMEALRLKLNEDIEIWKTVKITQMMNDHVFGKIFNEISPPNMLCNEILSRDYNESNLPLCNRILFDGTNPGSGKAYDYSLIPPSFGDYVLAGGLSIENIAYAINVTKPYCVDVSSGVEGSDGYKDMSLISEFLNIVRNNSKLQV